MKPILGYTLLFLSGVICERLDTILSRKGKSIHPGFYWLMGCIGMFLYFILGGYKG